MFILVHKRVCGPLRTRFRPPARRSLKPASKVEAAHYRADHAIQEVLELLEA